VVGRGAGRAGQAGGQGLMVGRNSTAAGLVSLLAFALACSKTEDTAPERRIFGAPPTIESVEVISTPGSSATCDWTESMKHIITCDFGFDPATLPFPFPTITINVTYNEIDFQVRATDAESTESQTDILLVTSSYTTNVGEPPQEISLVLLDDGGTNEFDFLQKGDFYGENCTPIDPSTCNDFVCNADFDGNGQPDTPRTDTCCCTFCTQKTYKLNTNDPVSGDGTYSRGFAFKKPAEVGFPASDRALKLFDDCLVSQKKQFPAESSSVSGGPLAFKIEAIDRSGNISEWPVKPEVSVQESTLTCEGDPCACCILTALDTVAQCKGLPGLVGQFDPTPCTEPPCKNYSCGLCNWIRFGGFCP
jgi:hypothetical protein